MASKSTLITKYCWDDCTIDCPIMRRYYSTEYDNLRSQVRHQNDLIENMTDQLRKERLRRTDYDTYKWTTLQGKVDLKSNTIKTLESELASWHSRVNNLYKNYSDLRNQSIKKDYSLEKLRADLTTCKDTLSDAMENKVTLESRMRDLEMKRKQAEFEYKQLFDQLHTKHVSWDSKNYTCTDAVALPAGYPCVNSCKPRRNSMCELEKLEKRGSTYERILIPYHLHALDMVDVKDIYKESWKCDICFCDNHPSSVLSNSRYPYHCYLCNYDVCQSCVDRMDGAVVTDHFTYFTH